MMPGDMIVCGVRGDVILDDIQVSVPQGHPVLIPVEKVVQSTDLYRELSSGGLFRLANNRILHMKPRVEETVPAKVAEPGPDLNDVIRQLREQNAALQAQVATLTKQLQSVPSQEDRLSEILTILKSRPEPNTQGSVRHVKQATEVVEEDIVPAYIPSQIKPTDIDSSRIVVEESSSKGSVSTAGNALRKLRAGQ